MGVAGALLEAAARGDAARLASILNADARDVDATDEIGRTALQRAAAEGHVQTVQLLLRFNADVNKQDHVYGNTAAHEAAWKGYSVTVGALARAGADLRVLNAAGFTPLHFACQNGHNQSTREILLAGAPPDLQNTYGDTPLHTAARYGHAGVTRILLSAQCRVSEQNRNGDTSLHIAAAMGRRKLTRILLEAGCDKSIRNSQGETARDIATRKGLEEIVHILNTPVAKQAKKKRDKSRERTIDEPDTPEKKDRNKKKKNVHFEKPAAQVQWSPYGCHYYPDPKFFPQPRLSSLPSDPLRKGEQYYLDLAGNIKKGPIGAGYTCYCAPFFKHMEDKLNEDKRDLKKHIDRAHEKLDRKVTDLELKTQDKISVLTRAVAAERVLCGERHKHLEQWLSRGARARASERVRRLDYSPRGELDIPPLKRTRSLELLDVDADEWNKVHRIIRTFNKNCEHYESKAKDLNESKATSRSTEVLDRRSPSPFRRELRGSRSSDRLESGAPPPPSHRHLSPRRPQSPVREHGHSQNVTAEIHVKSNRVSVSQSPVSVEMHGSGPRYASSSRRSEATSPTRLSTEPDTGACGPAPPPAPLWRSQVLQRTADDMKRRAAPPGTSLDIAQDGYVKLRKPPGSCSAEMSNERQERRRSVHELVAQVERHGARSPSPPPAPPPPPTGILKTPQQPQRPAPVLKEKPPRSKRFSLHNLIPFPTRKAFHAPPAGRDPEASESSDEEDAPIRSIAQPAPAPAPIPPRPASLLQTLPLPNYEAVSQSPSPFASDRRPVVPKDAYFHEIPNRQMPYRDVAEYEYHRAGLPTPTPMPTPAATARSRNPLQYTGAAATGVFDAMMQDHMVRELDRTPHCYSSHLDQNTEVEITNRADPYRGPYKPDPGLLHTRLQSLAINTHLPHHVQADRESHNDSGYSTKVYSAAGSSQGPSPCLSNHHEDNHLPNGKPILPPLGTSSLV